MDHLAPARLMEEVEAASMRKAALGTRSMLLKGFLSGALLAVVLWSSAAAAARTPRAEPPALRQ